MSLPYLLYAYPWMPYPRRVIIYLRERGIPESLVKVVPVSDPQSGDAAPPEFPPRPQGSLPILAIPSVHGHTFIRQAVPIMNYLEDLCESGEHGFPTPKYSMRGADPLTRARYLGYLNAADQCLTTWNPVRLFGSGLGPMSIPIAANESLKWVRRELAATEQHLKDEGLSRFEQDNEFKPIFGDIILFSFLELAMDVYGKDMTKGSGSFAKDAYGRDVLENYPGLESFYRTFGSRESAQRNAELGEEVADEIKRRGRTWADGIF